MTKVLAVASGGGHWEQLMLLRDALDAHGASYATTAPAQAKLHGVEDAFSLADCNKDRPFMAAWCAVQAFLLVMRLRPKVIISTGAAPGFFCIMMGRLVGARTLWIDSVANAEELSMCGKLSLKVAHQCLSQWEHLAKPDGPHFMGSVL